MSSLLSASPFASVSGAGSPFSVAGPGGESQFGFSVPLGDPGELQAASRACGERALGVSLQAGSVSQGVQTALSTWRGEAESAFGDYAAHLVSVLNENSGVFSDAALALSVLADELEHAQRVTTFALQECESCQRELSSALETAGAESENASDLARRAGLAAHPQVRSELGRQASAAQDAADAANRAAENAREMLEAARARGIAAAEAYEHQAAAITDRIAAAADAIRFAPPLPGGAPIPASLPQRAINLARRALSAQEHPAAQGSLIDALGGLVHVGSFGLLNFGNPDTPRYRGGEIAAMIPIDPDGLAVDAERVAAKDVLATPEVQNSSLQNMVNDLYKGTTNPNRVGSGTTADAVRAEAETGQPTGGVFHTMKAEQYSAALTKLLQSGNVDTRDSMVARSLLEDLQNALGNRP